YWVGFVPQADSELHYESSDCSGTAFLTGVSPGGELTLVYNVPSFAHFPPPVPQVFVHGALGAYQVGPVSAHAIRSRIFFTDEASCMAGVDGRTFTPPD